MTTCLENGTSDWVTEDNVQNLCLTFFYEIETVVIKKLKAWSGSLLRDDDCVLEGDVLKKLETEESGDIIPMMASFSCWGFDVDNNKFRLVFIQLQF